MKTEETRNATARVHVVLSVDCGAWGPDCTIGQADKQARDEALRRIEGLFKVDPRTLNGVSIVRVETVAVAFVLDAP